jgi:hypothetical protein
LAENDRRTPMMRTAILAGCVTILAVTPALSQSKATIQSLDDKFAEAFNKGDAAAVAAMYTEDAYVLPPGAEMVKGRNAIEALWRANMQQISDVRCTALDVKPLVGTRCGRSTPARSRQRLNRPRTVLSNMLSFGRRNAASGSCSRISGT